MKDLIKEVALSVAHSMQKALPIEVQYGVNTEFTVEFATAFLAELSKRAEAVHWRCVLSEEQRNSGFVATPTIAGFSKLKEAEAIENRVAEACAKYVWSIPDHNTFVSVAEAIRSGEWRKYK